MTLHHQLVRRTFGDAYEALPGIVERGLRFGVRRHIPGGDTGQFFQTKVGARVEPHDLAIFFQQLQERQKQRAVEPAFVQPARCDVRGRHHDDAEFEQPGEKPPKDHGVGDIGDVEFIEAEQLRFAGDGRGGALDRILIGQRAVFHFLAVGMNPLVHIRHELMKMRAAFALDRARLEEQIHQHGLAAPDLAVNVEPLQRRAGLFALGEQPSQR